MPEPTVDRSKPQKLYCQLLEALKLPIHLGEWKAGTRIPTEEQICRRYNVSKTTVRAAVEELVAHGYLNKIQGKGTYVLRSVPERSIRMATCLNAEPVGSCADSVPRVVADGDEEPPYDVARDLRLRSAERCWHLVRVQEIDGLPLALERLFVPLHRCAVPLGSQAECASLAACLERRCADRMQQMRERSDMGCLGARDAEWLATVPGTPVVRVTRVFFAPHGQPSGLIETLHRIDRFRQILEFERQ